MIFTDLFKQQEELDRRIVEEKGLEGEDLLSQKILALQVELGELANETRCFKFWSVKPPSGRSVILEEYTDCLQFVLSVGLELGIPSDEKFQINITHDNLTQCLSYLMVNAWKLRETGRLGYILFVNDFLGLGKMLGFSWGEIVKAYDAKNKINHQRQASGY